MRSAVRDGKSSRVNPFPDIEARLVLQGKLLYALPRVNFAGIQLSTGIHGSLMDPVELPCVASTMTERPHDSAVITLQNPDYLIASVSNEQVLLLGIMGEAKSPNGAIEQSLGYYEKFLNKLTLLG